MRNVWAIAGKECRVYLTTWTSYILFGAFMLITAAVFTGLVDDFQRASLHYMQQQAEWMLEQMNLTDLVVHLRTVAPVLGVSVFEIEDLRQCVGDNMLFDNLRDYELLRIDDELALRTDVPQFPQFFGDLSNDVARCALEK